MSEFEDFIKKGEVRIQEKNKILADSLIKGSLDRAEHIKRLVKNKEKPKYIVENIYDALRELIEAKLSLEGYKSYSHEATILFLKKFNQFNEFEIDLLDKLRKIRNGIKYYGKEATTEDAEKSLNFMKSIHPKLKKLVENVQ